MKMPNVIGPIACIAACSFAVAHGAAPHASSKQGAPILTDGSMWRAYYAMRTPVVMTDKGPDVVRNKKKAAILYCWSPFPPADWTKPEFDDSMWVMWTTKKFGDDPGYGFRKNGECLMSPFSLLCLRGAFLAEAPDRVKSLSLSLTYRGGFVAYLNGNEIGRGNLPDKAQLTFETLAAEYPADVQQQPQKRLRRAEGIGMPAGLLRRGVNVLAVEIHRPPHPSPAVIGDVKTEWTPCGLVRLELSAEGEGVTPNIDKPAGVQAWQLFTVKDPQDWEYCYPPKTAAGPVRIPAVRNGAFTAQIAVGAGAPVKGLLATITDLSNEKGSAKIPASAVKVLYYDRGRGYALTAAPPDETLSKRRPQAGDTIGRIWLKAYVPADAPAGLYSGKLAINVQEPAATIEKRVELKMYDWNLPNPRDYTVFIELMESPESVAMYYNVPLWSDEHFKLMDPSFALMGEAASRVINLPLIGHTNLGNSETIVRWIRKPDGTFDYDFKPVERYLDLALKYLAPKVVCLYLYDLYLGCTLHGEGKDNKGGGRMAAQAVKIKESGFRGPIVSLLDPATGKTSEMEGPPLNTPEARAFWKPVLAGVRARLAKRGLDDKIMIGITSDIHPVQYVADFFDEVLPGVNWFQHSHEAKFFLSHSKARMGYCAHVYGVGRDPFQDEEMKIPTGWSREDLSIMYPREHCCMQHHGIIVRRAPELSLYNGWKGTGRYGIDFWPVLGTKGSGYTKSACPGKDGRNTSISARYPESNWSQLNMHTQDFAFPGPAGAETTAPFERLREGIQECEMRIFLEKALLDEAKTAKLGAGLAGQVRDVLNERRLCFGAMEAAGRAVLERDCLTWCEGEPWSYHLPTRLMSCVEEAGRALGK